MPTLDEVALASDAEVETFIRQLLRPEETFRITLEETIYQGRVFFGEEVLWERPSYDKRTLLLDIYGYLWKRTEPAVSPLWQRRRELTREDVGQRARSVRIRDPEDLDPSEIRSVYEDFRAEHQHRKKD